MSVVYELLDNLDDLITIEAIVDSVYIDFPKGIDQMRLSADKAQQLIEYLKQAVVDIKGNAT